MEKVSKFISKKVISLKDGVLLGYVLNVIFDDDLKTFSGLIVVDEESENNFLIESKDIVSTGDDCIMIDNSSKLQFFISSSNSPIRKLVYDCYGNSLGRVIEVEISGKTVKKIITNRCEFSPRFVQKNGENFIIFGNAKRKKRSISFKEQVGENGFESLPSVSVTTQPQTNVEPENQTRLFANSNSLIGKIVTNEVLGLNNELIAKKFEIIDKKIIKKARMHNKLNLLAFYSK